MKIHTILYVVQFVLINGETSSEEKIFLMLIRENRMKLKLTFVSCIMVSLFLGFNADFAYSAGVTGHDVAGGSGLRPAAFPNVPGVIYQIITTYQNALSFPDKHGNPTAEPFEANGIGMGHKIVYTPDMERISWLGDARLHLHMVIPMSFSQMSAMDGPYEHSCGIGDPSVYPVLSWQLGDLQLAYALGAHIPAGDYDRDNPISIGKGFWTLVTMGGFTWEFGENNDWCLGGLVRYEKHYTTRHKDLRQGDDLSFEWSFSKTFAKEWEVGLAGYNFIQIKEDKGSYAAAASLEKDEVHGAGLEAKYTNFEHGYSIALRGMRDYKAENRPEAWQITTTFTFMF